MDRAHRIALTLCSPVALTVDGEPVSDHPLGVKSLALLAYLVLEARPHPREGLTALLWGDFPESRARASLRQALTQLRHALRDGLCVDRTWVALEAPVECDVAPFLPAPKGDARRALEVDVPTFLTGLPLRQCAGFDEWAAAMRRTLLRGYTAALATIAADALSRLEWPTAALAADRWRAADPLSDDAAAAAVEARVQGGDRGGALAIAAAHRERLAHDIARPPGRAFERLVERATHLAATPRGLPAQHERLSLERVRLHGRSDEWRALQRAWRIAAGGAERVVVIEGEDGAGKSRLADEFAQWVMAQEGVVLRGQGTEAGAAISFGTIAQLLRSGLDAPGVASTDGAWLAEVARLVPALRHRLRGLPATPAAAPGDGWRLIEGVAQLLMGIAAEQPLMLLLDDAHWCDGDSGAVIQSLVERLRESPICWCVTFAPGFEERGSAPARLSRALRATPESDVRTLARLDEGHVVAALEQLTGGAPASPALRELARLMHEESAGTARLLSELLAALGEQGVLVHALAGNGAQGDWRLASETLAPDAMTKAAAVALERFRGPIDARIARLTDDARAILVTIAMADGAECNPRVLSHMHGISSLRSATLSEVLIERALVVEEGGGYRCAHPAIGNLVRRSVSASWRREARAALTEALMKG